MAKGVKHVGYYLVMNTESITVCDGNTHWHVNRNNGNIRYVHVLKHTSIYRYTKFIYCSNVYYCHKSFNSFEDQSINVHYNWHIRPKHKYSTLKSHQICFQISKDGFCRMSLSYLSLSSLLECCHVSGNRGLQQNPWPNPLARQVDYMTCITNVSSLH